VSSDLILVLVVVAALAFDFTNGFHDSTTVVATSISTGAVAPRVAIGFAAALNFAGAFISLEVAATVANDVIDPAAIDGSLNIVFAALVGAIAWNLITWFYGLPTSSSHALIGAMIGAALVAVGSDALLADGIVGMVLIPAVVAPILAFLVAVISIGCIYRIVARLRPGPAARGFRFGQLISGGMLALAHGSNDAQKTMGVITLALVANGNLGQGADTPFWVIAAAAAAIAVGTYSGGWRVLRTTGARIKMDTAQGFSAQGAGAAVILASTHFGYPLSTTHVINGGVMGAGAGKRLSAVRWGVARNIVVSWLITLPAAALIGAAAYGCTRIFGTGALGPVLVTLLGLSLVAAAFGRRYQRGSPLPAA
jgi:inorganic phosphate transporter, PiT family